MVLFGLFQDRRPKPPQTKAGHFRRNGRPLAAILPSAETTRQKPFRPFPDLLWPALCLVLFVLTWTLFPRPAGALENAGYAYVLGFVPSTWVHAADYYPLLPWIFIYGLGVWCGRFVKAGKLPAFFYTWRVPLLPWVGRHALVIYLVHQPLILLVLMGLGLQVL